MDNRRGFLAFSLVVGAGFFLNACNRNDSPSTRKGAKGMFAPPTNEEMELLQNFDLRQSKLSGSTLIIRNRIFDLNVRFDPFHWENTQFINCDFIQSILFRGVLNNVHFENCTFINIRFEESEWNDVIFAKCAGRGNFTLVADSGKNAIFDDCEFIGSTPQQLGYGGISDSFGGIGGTDGEVIYRKCHLERVIVNGGSSVIIQDCKMIDVIGSADDDATLLLQNIEGKGFVKFHGATQNFTSVTVKDSRFEVLTFREANIRNGLFERVKANLGLSESHAHNIILKDVTFLSEEKPEEDFRYGLNTNSAKIQNLTIENCLFEGKQVALNLLGNDDLQKDEALLKGEKHINKYSTTINTLIIRNTPIIRGKMEYMEVKSMLLENLTIQGADFSHGNFGQFILRNVALSGVVDFTDTKIKERIYDRVENTSTGTQPTILKP